MAQRSPAEADRYIDDIEEMGGANDSTLRQWRSVVAEERGRSHARAFDTANSHFARARQIGEETRDEFETIAERADAITLATNNGELGPEEGRRTLDALLARHNLASTRADTFTAAATAAVEIEADPEAWSEAFFAAHPSVRPEMWF